MRRIFFDSAASTQIAPEVVKVMTSAMLNLHANPSSIHNEGRRCRAAIEKARKSIATEIGASIGEIFFTSGGTESNNMAIKCAVRDLGVKHIITSCVEHHCVLNAVKAAARDYGVSIDRVSVNQYGEINMEELETLLKSKTEPTLVTIMHANNEVGCINDIVKIGNLCRANNAYFHSDTVQTVGHYPINVDELPVDFISGAGHKFHGPNGIGFLWINSERTINPLIDGGAQERNMRAGTENIYGILGMAKALEMANENYETHKAYILNLKDTLRSELQNRIPGISFNENPDKEHLYTVLNVSFPPHPKSDLLILNMDIHGIAASGGSACSSGAAKGSHVIAALGGDPCRTAVRFSFSHMNTLEEVVYVAKTLEAIYVPRTVNA